MSVKIERDDLELEQVCRACLGNENELVDLFWRMDTTDRDLTLADIFMMCTPVEVSKEDGMPQKICEVCINSLTSAYEFRARCQQNDMIIKSMLSNIENVTTIVFHKDSPSKDATPTIDVDQTVVKTEPDDDELYNEDAEAVANLSKLMGDDMDSYFTDYILTKKAAPKEKKKESCSELCLGNKQNRIFKCTECDKTFNCNSKLSRHMNVHGSQSPKRSKTHQCELCGIIFEKRVELNEHTVMHSSALGSAKGTGAPNKKPKRKARKLFVSKRKRKPMSDEINYISPKKSKSDDACNLQSAIGSEIEMDGFNSNGSLVKEEPIFDEIQLFEKLRKEFFRVKEIKKNRDIQKKVCAICYKETERNATLKNHIVEHAIRYIRETHPYYGSEGSDSLSWKVTKIPFVCNLCCDEKEFFSIWDLKMHFWNWMNITTYACKLCNKTFGNSSNFSKHKKVHGMHFRKCNLCLRKFTTMDQLNKHREYHKANEPIECCGKLFHFMSTLRKHERSVHNTTKVYNKKMVNANLHQCQACQLSFSSIRERWEHNWTEHGSRHYDADCSLCGKKFRTLLRLKQHINNHHSYE